MYRFLGAIFLSYSRYDNKSPSNIRANPTGSVPISAALVFYTILGTVLAIFCAILFVSSCRDAIYALSTIEIARQNKRRRLGPDCKPAYRYIQLPGHAIGGKDNDEAAIEVRNVPLNMNLYDFGLIGNLKRIFGRSMVEYLSESYLSDYPKHVLISFYHVFRPSDRSLAAIVSWLVLQPDCVYTYTRISADAPDVF